MRARPPSLLPVLLCVAGLSGCGASSSSSSRPATPTSTVAQAVLPGAGSPSPAAGLAAAELPAGRSFPAPRGRSLRALAAVAHAQATLGLATGTFVPGANRIAFALTNANGSFLYGPTAVYLASSPDSPATGPYLAPADPVGVAAQFRSRQNAGPGDIQAVYETTVPIPRARTYAVLALTHAGGRTIGATGEIAAAAATPVPGVGGLAPRVATETPASPGAGSLLTTRVPPEPAAMHAASLAAVLGHRPVALLFSTPQLCQSRVCGPVTDIAVSLLQRFAPRMQFIHEEVFVGNQPNRGLRPQMKAFHLQTEPWLFVIDRHGRIAARLEGTFGVSAFTAALERGLR